MAVVDAAAVGMALTDDRAARLAAAETALIKALSLAPQHARAHWLLGHVQIFTNRAAQGIAECEQALALDRNLANAHAYIGRAKYLLGRGEETEAHVQEALRLSPRDTEAFCLDDVRGLRQAAARRRRGGGRLVPSVASRSTEIIHARISILPPRWRTSVGLMRRGPRPKRGLRSIPTFTISPLPRQRAERQSDLPRWTRALL